MLRWSEAKIKNIKAKNNVGNIQEYTPITVYQTASFQTRKFLIDLVGSCAGRA